MSTDLSELRRQRGSAKGQVTRMKQAILKMKGKPLPEYDLTTLERYESLTLKANQTFLDCHAKVCEVDKVTEQAKLDDEAEENEQTMDVIRQAREFITTCISARSIGKSLMIQLQDIKCILEADKYMADMAPQYTKVEEELQKFRELMAQHDLSDQAEMEDLRTRVNRLWAEARHSRSESGYTPPGDKREPKSKEDPEDEGCGNHIKVEPPMFYGKIVEFQDFKEIFLNVVKGKKLNETAKKTILQCCMGTKETKEYARVALKDAPTVKVALERLSQRYENGRDVVAYHFKEIVHNAPVQLNYEGSQRTLRLLNDHAKGIEKAKCLTAGQLIVAVLDSQFSDDLQMQWRLKTDQMDQLPDVQDLKKYMESLQRVLSPKVVISEHSEPKHSPNRKQQAPKSKVSREPSPPPSQSYSKVKSEDEYTDSKQVFQVTKAKFCVYCKGAHSPFSCSEFRAKTPEERQAWVQDQKRCSNCLKDNHTTTECRVDKRCQDCGSKHHSLLHVPRAQSPTSESSSQANDYITTSVGSHAGPPVTALVLVSAGRHRRYARALLDTGAEVTLVSKALAISLEAQPLMSSLMTIGGVGSAESPYAILLDLHGEEVMQKADESLRLEARVMMSIPQPTSTANLHGTKSLPFLQDYPLADPDYSPGDPVDIILDNKAWQLSRTGETLAGPQRGIFADGTMFGWVVGGTPYKHNRSPQILITQKSDRQLDKALESQWVSPDMPGDHIIMSMGAAEAEASFMSSYKRLED